MKSSPHGPNLLKKVLNPRINLHIPSYPLVNVQKTMERSNHHIFHGKIHVNPLFQLGHGFNSKYITMENHNFSWVNSTISMAMASISMLSSPTDPTNAVARPGSGPAQEGWQQALWQEMAEARRKRDDIVTRWGDMYVMYNVYNYIYMYVYCIYIYNQ